jgi:uncharacterized protein
MARLNYLELPVSATPSARAFYETVFGWTMVDFGPEYAGTTTGDVDIGLDASAERVSTLLPVILVDDLAATQASIIAAGGTITVPIFSFPGGQRFHFKDHDGNQLAAWVTV